MITSRHNAVVRHTRAVREGKIQDLIFIEGVRLCEEAVRAALIIEDVLYTERFMEDARGAQLLAELRQVCQRINMVSQNVLTFVSDTKTPQGILLLARRPQVDRNALLGKSGDKPLIVIMHQVGNPSNAGAMLRVAEAAGATGAIATEGSTDLFSPKALRGAMGSSFRLPLWTRARFDEVIVWCAEHGIRTIGTDVRALQSHTEIDWRSARAIIVGAEAGGLAETEKAAVDVNIRIPMRPPVESLNVAVALAIALYEAARQRGELK